MDSSSKLLAIALLATGCSREIYQAEPPSEVQWTATIQAGADGRLVAASALEPYDGRARTVPKHEDAVTIWVVGFEAETIAALGEVRQEGLSEGTGCDATLPEPSWTAQVLSEGELSFPMPKLTAPWLRASCPTWSSVEIDVACAPLRCAAYVTQNSCSARIDLAGCMYPEITAQIHPDGSLCIPESERRCRVKQGTSLECTVPAACSIELYPDPDLPNWTVESLTVVEGAAPQEPESVREHGLDTVHRYVGWFADFAINGDKLFVATHAGRFQASHECAMNQAMEARIFSADTLSPISSAPLPICTSRITPDPRGPGFMGIFFDAGWKVGRFDETAALVATATITLPSLEGNWTVRAAVQMPSSSEVWFLMNEAVPDRYILVAVDPDSMSVRIPLVVEGNTATDAASSPDGLMALTESFGDAIRFFDTTNGHSAGFGITNAALSIRLGHLSWIPGAQEFLVAVPGEEPALYMIGAPSLGDRGRGFLASRDVRPMTTSTWPEGQDLALVGTLTEAEPRQALFAVYDVKRDRIHPEIFVAGRGAPTQMKQIGDSVYVGLGWEGRILKITP